MRTTVTKAPVVLVVAISCVDPEARCVFLMERAQGPEGAGSFASKRHSILGDHVRQRPFTLECFDINAG